MKKYLIKNNEVYNKIILTNLKLLILFIPLFCNKNIVYLRINQELILKLFIIFTFTSWVLSRLNNTSLEINISKLNLPIFLFVLIMTISLLNTNNLIISLREYIIFLFYIILFFLIISNVKSEWQFNSFIKILFFTSTAISIYTLMHYYGVNLTYLKEYSDIVSPIGNKNLISNYLATTFPIILSYYLLEDKRKSKIIYYLILSICYATIIICQTRGIWISIFLTLIIGIYLFIKFKFSFNIFRKNNKWLILLFVTIAVITIIYSTGNILNKGRITTVQKVASIYEDDFSSMNSRLIIWQTTIDMIKVKPIFGIGIGSFKMNYHYYQAKVIENNKDYLKYWRHPLDAHNEYLQIGAELGLIGLLVFLYVIYIFYNLFLRYIKKEKNVKNQIIALGLIGGMTIYLFHCMFSFPFRIPALGATFFTILGLTFIYTKNIFISKNVKEKNFIKIKIKKSKYNIIFSMIIIIAMILTIDFIAIKPYLAEINYGKGKIQSMEGNYNVALPYLEHGEKLDPFNGRILRDIGGIYYKFNMYNESIRYFNEAKKYSNDINIYRNLGLCYTQTGNYVEAEKNLKYVIFLDPKFIKAYFNLGYLYYLQEEFDRAIEQWDNILSIESNYEKRYIIFYYLGMAHFAKDINERALDYFNQALELAPDGNPIIEEIEKEIYNIYKSDLGD
jgi:O-antigen ligase/Tfp pilus assembly protein PilF